jgi:lysophospholipase L1-like esterase
MSRSRGWGISSVPAVLVLLTLTLTLPIPPAARAAAAAPPLRIMLVGDSITEGSSGDWTWRYRLARYLDASGVDYEFVGPHTTMLDLATNAHTSQEYADPDFDTHHYARWGQSFHMILDANAIVPEDAIGTAVSTYQPDLVIEVLGINDLLYGSSPEETLDVAREFVDDVRAARPDTSVVMSTVPGEQYAHVADFNDLLRTAAPAWSLPSSPVVVSDPAPGWSASVDTCDSTHPSATGEVEIAAAQQDALSDLGIGAPAPRPLPTPPAGPRLPAVLDVTPGDRQAFLTWQLPPGGTAVLISARDVTTGSEWQRLPFAVGGTSWTSGGLQNGDTYEYRLNVLKHDCLAADIFSDVAQVTPEPDVPGPVPDLVASPLDHGLLASWSTVEGATGYVVWVRPAGDPDGWTTHPTAATTLSVSGLEAGRSYDLAVQARNGGGAGPLSMPVQAIPIGASPAAPGWTSGIGSVQGAVTLGWGATEQANAYELTYRVDRPGAPWIVDPRRLSAASAVVTGLRPGLSYAFVVRGVDDRLPGSWSTELSVNVPRVGPVRHVVGRLLHGGRVHSEGLSVADASSYALLSVETRSCTSRPGYGRFEVVAKDLVRPHTTFTRGSRNRAVWLRWRAAYGVYPGTLARSSTTCVLLRPNPVEP